MVMLTTDCLVPWYEPDDVNELRDAFYNDGGFAEHEIMSRFKYDELEYEAKPWDAKFYHYYHTWDMYWNFKQVFEDFSEGLEDHAAKLGMAMKEKHTVVEEWPCRLKKKANEKGAQAESCRAFKVHYVLLLVGCARNRLVTCIPIKNECKIPLACLHV